MVRTAPGQEALHRRVMRGGQPFSTNGIHRRESDEMLLDPQDHADSGRRRTQGPNLGPTLPLARARALCGHGGAAGNRTPDLFDANEARYQLRYSPKCARRGERWIRITAAGTLDRTRRAAVPLRGSGRRSGPSSPRHNAGRARPSPRRHGRPQAGRKHSPCNTGTATDVPSSAASAISSPCPSAISSRPEAHELSAAGSDPATLR